MSDAIPAVNARPVVLIGPVCVGKSAAGTLVAERLGREFIEADWVSSQVYAERGWSPARFAELKERRGAEAAYDDFEAFAAASARQLLYAYPGAVIAMGAGHTHYRSRQRHEDVLAAFEAVQATTVLLLPCADPLDAVRQLRQRAVLDRADDFRRDDRDLLAEWVHSQQNRRLATHTVITARRTPAETADEIIELTASRPAP